VWGIVELYTGFWWGNLKERDHSENPDVDGMIIFRLIFRQWDECTDSVDLAQDRDRWRVFVNAGNFLTN
jgi:hypothetical protein